MKRILIYTIVTILISLTIFNSCSIEDDKIDYYISDTTLSIWSQKFNKQISKHVGNDTIVLSVDSFPNWATKVNTFIKTSYIQRNDTILYGADNFEAWRTKFNTAIDSNYNDSAEVLFLRFTEYPDTTLRTSISQWYDTIQYYNIDDSLDTYYNYALHNSTDALLDWFRDTSSTLVNSPTWSQYQGFTTNGTNSYLRLNYNPGVDAVNYSLNYNSLTLYTRTNNFLTNTYLMGMYDGSVNTTLRISATSYLTYNNGTGIWTTSHGGDITGSMTVKRNGAGVFLSRNGGDYITSGLTQTAIPNQANGFYLGCNNQNGSPLGYLSNEYSMVAIGGELSQLQATKLHEANERYLDAFDRGVDPLAASPYLTSDLNVFALQTAIGSGDTTINLTTIGDYEFDAPIYLYDSTTITWAEGANMEMSQSYNPVFINEGALTGQRNYNIELNNLKLITNEYQAGDTLIWGMRGHLTFHTVTDVRLNDIECTDLGAYNFFSQWANWQNVSIDGWLVTGNKESLHFHHGDSLIIKNATLGCYDDMMFLGSQDYPYILPDSIGDISNVYLTNVTDSNIFGNSGYNTRVYLASWDDWTNGNTYNTGDMSLNASKIYQVVNSAGFSATGTIAPTHTTGKVTGADGVTWKFKDNGDFYKCDIFNINYDSCNYNKNRGAALYTEYNEGVNSRNIYPTTEDSSKLYNITYTNCSINYPTETMFIAAPMGIQDITLENNYFNNLSHFYWSFGGAEYSDSLTIYSIDNDYNDISTGFLSSRTNLRKVFFNSSENSTDTYSDVSALADASNGGILRAINYNIPFNNLIDITPVLNDTVLATSGLNVWNGVSWDLLP